jgi:hypothetical protein
MRSIRLATILGTSVRPWSTDNIKNDRFNLRIWQVVYVGTAGFEPETPACKALRTSDIASATVRDVGVCVRSSHRLPAWSGNIDVISGCQMDAAVTTARSLGASAYRLGHLDTASRRSPVVSAWRVSSRTVKSTTRSIVKRAEAEPPRGVTCGDRGVV